MKLCRLAFWPLAILLMMLTAAFGTPRAKSLLESVFSPEEMPASSFFVVVPLPFSPPAFDDEERSLPPREQNPWLNRNPRFLEEDREPAIIRRFIIPEQKFPQTI